MRVFALLFLAARGWIGGWTLIARVISGARPRYTARGEGSATGFGRSFRLQGVPLLVTGMSVNAA